MNVPALRFPEFKGEWKEKKLKDISRFHDGKRIPLKDADRVLRKGSFPYYGASGVIDYIDDYIFDGEYILLGEDGANIITRSSPLAFCVRGKFWANNHAHVIEAKGVAFFLAESLERIRYEKYNTGTAQPKLNAEACKNIKLFTPDTNEQQKIANFLTTVDKKITQLTQKKALLEDYKKGCMQQLFSQQIRFKDDEGNDYPDWTSYRIDELGKTFTGLSGKTASDFGSGKAYITYRQVFRSGQINPNDFGFVAISASERQNSVKYGDILFTMSSEIPSEVGFSASITSNLKETYLNSFCFGLRPNNIGFLIPEFSQYLFKSDSLRRKIIPLAQGSTRYNLSKNSFLKLSLDIPHFEEQQKIAKFLSVLDKKIDSVQKQIEHTQQFKKGLLQQMFV